MEDLVADEVTQLATIRTRDSITLGKAAVKRSGHVCQAREISAVSVVNAILPGRRWGLEACAWTLREVNTMIRSGLYND